MSPATTTTTTTLPLPCGDVASDSLAHEGRGVPPRLALEIAGTGMVTALGSSTAETIAALDRGDRRVVQTGLVDLRGDRIAGAFALPVRDDITGALRAERLTLPALAECLDSISPVRGPTALFVCAPLPWGSFGADFAPAIASPQDDWTTFAIAIAGQLESRGHHGCSERPCLVRRGHAAGVLALCQIQKLFERGEAALAVIVGVDTHGDRSTLERLDLAGHLKSRRSPGGFVPGEAAAVLCVRPVCQRSGLSGAEKGGTRESPRDAGFAAKKGGARAVVRGLGLDTETDRPSTARGLTSAVAQALSSWGGAARSIATVTVDLNGERGRAKEWTFAATRTLWTAHATPVLEHPGDRLGDVGAATVPVLLALTARRTLAGPCAPLTGRGGALAVASSRDGLRGVVVLDVDDGFRGGIAIPSSSAWREPFP